MGDDGPCPTGGPGQKHSTRLIMVQCRQPAGSSRCSCAAPDFQDPRKSELQSINTQCIMPPSRISTRDLGSRGGKLTMSSVDVTPEPAAAWRQLYLTYST